MRNGIIKLLVLSIAAAIFLWGATDISGFYKKRVAVELFENPATWNQSGEPGSLISEIIFHALEGTGNYQLIPVSPVPEEVAPEGSSTEETRNPAQIIIAGRVLNFNPGLTSKELDEASENTKKIPAAVEMELVLKDSFTHKIHARKIIKKSSTTGTYPFAFLEGPLNLKDPVFQKSAMGDALMKIAKDSVAFIKNALKSVPLEAVIIEVDKKREEVVLNVGKASGLEIRDKFYVLDKQPNFTDPLTRYNLGDKINLLGVVKVKSVFENYSLAEIVAGKSFKDGMVVQPRNFAVEDEEKPWWQFYGHPALLQDDILFRSGEERPGTD